MLAQLSDLHVRAAGDGDQGDGDQGASRLAAVVEAVVALDPAPDAVLVSGDLGENGTAAEYERVAELLARLPMPVHVLPGNHDDRSVMGGHFPGGSGAEPWSYATVLGPLRLVACDTTVPGEDAGSLDGGPARLAPR